VPLRIGDKTLGVVGVAKEKDGPALDSEARALLDTLAEQTAAALDRASLTREMVSTRTASETERVRNTLLASISHDFRTPLSSILGSATSLIEYGDKLDIAAKNDLLGQIKTEAEDLDEMVRNLLAITRIDAGALEIRPDWIDLGEIVERVVNAARRRGAVQTFATDLPADLPLVRADATLAERVVSNVVANAVAHTPSARAWRSPRMVRLIALRSISRTTAPALRPTTCPKSSTSSSKRAAKVPVVTAVTEQGSALQSPKASWMRMAARSRRRAPSAAAACVSQ